MIWINFESIYNTSMSEWIGAWRSDIGLTTKENDPIDIKSNSNESNSIGIANNDHSNVSKSILNEWDGFFKNQKWVCNHMDDRVMHLI